MNRTFYPEVYPGTDRTKAYTRLYNDHYDFVIVKAVRKAFCRGCGDVIPAGVFKIQRRVEYSYGRLGNKLVTFSYCPRCYSAIKKQEEKSCMRFIKRMKKVRLTRKQLLECKQKMNDIKLLEAL